MSDLDDLAKSRKTLDSILRIAVLVSWVTGLSLFILGLIIGVDFHEWLQNLFMIFLMFTVLRLYNVLAGVNEAMKLYLQKAKFKSE